MKYENVRLVRVVDGDTCVLSFELGFDVRATVHVRLAGINAPEPVGIDATRGAESKLALERLLSPGGVPTSIVAVVGKQDKYGRWLAELLVPSATGLMSVNRLMVAGGFAVEYHP